MIDRSEAWVSQVERGVRRIDRMTVLRQVAEVLEVPLAELAADTPVVAAASSRSATATGLRMLVSSSLALSLAAAERMPESVESVDLAALRSGADQAWELAHATGYEQLVPLVVELLPKTETAVRVGSADQRVAACQVLARIYHACAAALVKLGELPAAWVCADRAIAAAERAGDLLLMAEGAFRLTVVFQFARQYDQATATAGTAAAALAPLVEQGQLAAVSLRGALRLQLAVTAARQNEAEQAYAYLDAARGDAERLGGDRNDYHTEFGPTNVTLHRVGVAVELGDAGAALRAAAGVDASALSPERQGRLFIDVARAQMQRRNGEATIAALMNAERVAPEQTRRHWITRNLLQDLDHAGHGRDARVRDLTERCRTA